jgi:hypothetical protein
MDEPGAQPPSPQPKDRRRRFRWGAVATFVVLVAIAAYATLHQGVKTINFTNGTISFNQVGTSKIQQQQPTLRAQVSQAVSRARDQATSGSGTVDFAGEWSSNYGLTYVIAQYGDQVVVQERSPYGITAVGQGTVQGDSADFGYEAVDGSIGQAVFTLVDSQTIDANFDNTTFNTSSTAVLKR